MEATLLFHSLSQLFLHPKVLSLSLSLPGNAHTHYHHTKFSLNLSEVVKLHEQFFLMKMWKSTFVLLFFFFFFGSIKKEGYESIYWRIFRCDLMYNDVLVQCFLRRALNWKIMQKQVQNRIQSQWSWEMIGGKGPDPSLQEGHIQRRTIAGSFLAIYMGAPSIYLYLFILILCKFSWHLKLNELMQLIIVYWNLLLVLDCWLWQSMWVVWYLLRCSCQECLCFPGRWHVQNRGDSAFL